MCGIALIIRCVPGQRIGKHGNNEDTILFRQHRMPVGINFVKRIEIPEDERLRLAKRLQEEEVERYKTILALGHDAYFGIYGTTEVCIPTSISKQQYDKLYDGTLCYLCRSVLAPNLTAEFLSTRAFIEPGATSYRDGWDSAQSKIHKPHFACFDCRKVWKPMERSLVYTYHYKHLVAEIPAHTRCSTCRKPGTYMGLNFRAPRKSDLKGWVRAKSRISEDPLAFEASCKCR